MLNHDLNWHLFFFKAGNEPLSLHQDSLPELTLQWQVQQLRRELIKLGQRLLGVQQRLLVDSLRASTLTEHAAHGTLQQGEAIFAQPPGPAQHSSEGVSEAVLQPSSASGRV